MATRREKYNVPNKEEIEAIPRLAESDLPPLDFTPDLFTRYCLLPLRAPAVG